MNQENFAVVIPAYNEAATIAEVARGALEACPRVIVVDDGSADGTADRVADLPVLLLRNPANRGKAASLWRGMEEALKLNPQGVVTLDGDGQHDPRDIPRLVRAAARFPGHVVIGSRLHQRENIPCPRYYANRFANFWIAWAAGYPIADSQSGFRYYPADLLRRIDPARRPRHSFVFESEILIEAGRLGFPSVATPIAAVYPAEARPSHFRPVLDVLRIARMVACRLLRRGLFLRGLYRSLKGRPLFAD